MHVYVLKRVLAVVPVLLGLTVIVFAIMALIPGDPAIAILGSYATPENVDRLNRDLGLDKPLVQQYFIWIENLLHGDFGRSYSLNRPVLDEVWERFSATLILAGAALVLCTLWGLLIGIWTAARQYGWTDRILTFVVLIGISVPSFWLGLLLRPGIAAAAGGSRVHARRRPQAAHQRAACVRGSGGHDLHHRDEREPARRWSA